MKHHIVTGFVGGINYAKRHPDFMDFDVSKYHNPDLDWSRYNRRGALAIIGRCNRAAESFFDMKKEEREKNIEDLKKIIWYTEVVLDEEKLQLDRNAAFNDLGMDQIFKKYL